MWLTMEGLLTAGLMGFIAGRLIPADSNQRFVRHMSLVFLGEFRV